jgi:hypothetical protein
MVGATGPGSHCGFLSVWMVENSLAESRTEETKHSQKEVERVCWGWGWVGRAVGVCRASAKKQVEAAASVGCPPGCLPPRTGQLLVSLFPGVSYGWCQGQGRVYGFQA